MKNWRDGYDEGLRKGMMRGILVAFIAMLSGLFTYVYLTANYL